MGEGGAGHVNSFKKPLLTLFRPSLLFWRGVQTVLMSSSRLAEKKKKKERRKETKGAEVRRYIRSRG